MAPLSVDFADRISELESELAHEPSAGVFAPLAEAYRLSGRLANALETARRGVEAYPDHLGIRIVLARATAESCGRAEALTVYEEVLARDARNLEARAFVEAAAEEPPAAEKPPPAQTDGIWSPAVEDDAESGYRAGTGSLSEELAHLADLFMPAETGSGTQSLGPSSIATLTLAEIYSRQGLYGKAAEVCEHILEREPDNERARSALEEYRSHPASV